jgi:putative ABC transport system permease protein
MVAVVLLAGAGLMMKSLWRMTSYPPGFEPGQILTLRVEFTGAAYREDAARYAYVDALLARARSLPGVQDAALTTDRGATMLVLKEGEAVPEDRESRAAPVSAVSPSFGPLLGMSLVRGRWLNEVDTRSTILINEALARRDYPGIDPIGQRIHLPWVDNRGLGTIVGVVRNLKYARIDVDAEPEVFAHYKSRRLFGVTLALRLEGDPLAAEPTITKALGAADPTQSLFSVKTMEQRLDESIAPRRFNVLLLGTFALVAVVLVALGLYGVVAYSVAQRTHEIGIRVALGADRGRVVGMIVRHSMVSVVAGLGVGVAIAALAAPPLLAGLLYDVAPTDAPTLAVATLTLATLAFLASTVPALRAAFVDPATALRAE